MRSSRPRRRFANSRRPIGREQWRAQQDAIRAENELNREEVVRRLSAVKAQAGLMKSNPAVPNGNGQHKEDERLAKFRRMLNLVGDEVLRNEIITGLTSDEALELAEEFEKPETRDALIRHSLSGMAVQ